MRTPTLMLALLLTGCGSSKWAMDRGPYLAKYNRPYEEGEKLPRMAKQWVDARHVAGGTGAYVSAVGAARPFTAGGELGLFLYPPEVPWAELRGGLSGIAGTSQIDFFGGFDLGARLQTPTRLAPFFGLGGFAGSIEAEEYLGTEGRSDRLLAGYPEAGIHYWLNSAFRISGFGRYYMTSAGGNDDFWVGGISLSYLSY